MPSSSTQLCELSPHGLYFPEPHDRIIENHLTLKDLPGITGGNSYIVFGIKSTTPARYVVRPRYGLIKPGGAADVSIALRENACYIEPSAATPPDAKTLATLKPVKELKDKFQIDFCTVDAEQHDQTLSKLLLKDAVHHNGKEEQALIRDLYKKSSAAASAKKSSMQVACHFYNVAVEGGEVSPTRGAKMTVLIPAEANVAVKNSGGDTTKLVSPAAGNNNNDAPNAERSASKDGRPPLHPPTAQETNKKPADEQKPASSTRRGRTPSPTGGEGGSSELADLKNQIDAKQKEHDDLSVKLAKLEEELSTVRKSNDDMIATTAKTATLLKRYKDATAKDGGKKLAKGGAGREQQEKSKIPFSIIVLLVAITFLATLLLRDRLPKGPMRADD